MGAVFCPGVWPAEPRFRKANVERPCKANVKVRGARRDQWGIFVCAHFIFERDVALQSVPHYHQGLCELCANGRTFFYVVPMTPRGLVAMLLDVLACSVTEAESARATLKPR